MADRYKRYESVYTISHYSCNDCPVKLFTKDTVIHGGIGNPMSNTMIVYPMYISSSEHRFAELTDIICQAYKNKYNINPLESIYITPVIKCRYKTSRLLNHNQIIEKCAIKTISEFVNYDGFKKVIFIGDSINISLSFPIKIPYPIHIKCPYKLLDGDNDERKQFINELIKYI